MINKKIIITGAAGFLGTYLARHFNKLGWKVFGIGHGKPNDEDENIYEAFISADITLENLCKFDIVPDVVVHAAGGSSVALSVQNPLNDFLKTVSSIAHVLEFIRLKAQNAKLVYLSSAAVYGAHSDSKIKLATHKIPVSPYGFHKHLAEELCFSYGKSYDIKFTIVRFFSVYGEGLKKQLLWDTVNKFRGTDQVVEFWGTGEETRDWIYINDAVDLVYTVTESTYDLQLINGAASGRVTVRKVIELVKQVMSAEAWIRFNHKEKIGDPKYYWADVDVYNQLGWAPKISLSEGISKYVDWAINEEN